MSRLCNRFHPALVAVLSGLMAMTGGMLFAQPGAVTKEQSLLPVVYFYSPTCMECKKARVSIDAAERKYAGKILVEHHSIASAEGLDLMFAYEEKYGGNEGAPPKVFVGKHCLSDAPAIIGKLDGLIQDALASQSQATTPVAKLTATTNPAPASELPTTTRPAPPIKLATAIEPQLATELARILDNPLLAPQPQRFSSAVESPPQRPDMMGSDITPPVAVTPTPLPLGAKPQDPASGSRLERRFQSFQVGAIVLAGLVDGVNPCAFATVVFLLSAVAYLGKTKREIAIVGIAFTFAVFATYMLLGVGLMLAVKTFAMQTGISQIVTYVIAGLTFALAGWSLFDGIRIRVTGKVPKVTLGLPQSLKGVIRRVIKAGLKTRNLVIGSLLVGFLVSLVESFCTGQVYVPTIMIMLRAPGHGPSALMYLLMYNLMFIMPLAVIMVCAYYGVRSERVGQVLKGHLAALKFALAGLFAGLGLILLLM